MPRSRVFGSLALSAVSVSVLALTIPGCKHKPSSNHHDSPAPSTVPSSAKNDPDFHPLHPGHRNQRDPKGGFLPALLAPAPAMIAAFKAAVFDSLPEEVKLVALKAENGHCGLLDLGLDTQVVLDCFSDDYSMVPNAAVPVIGGEDLKSLRQKRQLPAVVDHRKDGTEGVIMNQGKSAACTAFSLTGAADHAAAHFLGQAPTLSPMHAWARYHQPSMKLAENDNVNKGLTDMADFPFDSKLAQEWMHSEKRPDPGQLHSADQKALVEITNITRLDVGSMTEIKSALAAGQDVWFSIKGAHGLMHPKKNSDGESMVGDWDYRKASSKGGHAILLSGYEDTPKGTFYLIHNSWGPKWGTEGYAWIWEKTLKTNIGDAYVVQVHPTENSHPKRVPSIHKFSSCTTGLAPDATTTQCVPACGDGGPRVNGVCPAAGQCPDGWVNLDGKCELSAPLMNKTLSNGTKVTCGISGCTYVVPNGQSSCSSSDGCTISCAAPRFMLGTGPRGLACNG